ncbi:hypothetical protein CK203_013203 [Vitis vinifera]|uniref:Uncharacterized protein n=1 Tax=Vitis vinifera TaxID=29760 RepID=A0A438JQ98_VITVI|nr:hypothetical protein CK203_013203 [Vitis vinifera]
MASSRNYPNGLSIAAIMLLIILSLPLLPSRSVGSESSEDGENLKQMKMVLGSRPPRCVNRCLSCTPCTAALVIPPPIKMGSRHSLRKMRAITSSLGNANVETSYFNLENHSYTLS